MRIYEIDAGYQPTRPDTDFVSGQAGVLQTILQHFISKNEPGKRVPTNHILKLMANAGFAITYPELDNLIKSNDSLKQIFGNNYNADNMQIGQETGPEDMPADAEKAAGTVDQMASRASQL
jgi:hypothetical protein